MNILYYRREDAEYSTPERDISNPEDPETNEFAGTELAHCEKDDENTYTLYTTGHHFYITLTQEDVDRICAMNTLSTGDKP